MSWRGKYRGKGKGTVVYSNSRSKAENASAIQPPPLYPVRYIAIKLHLTHARQLLHKTICFIHFWVFLTLWPHWQLQALIFIFQPLTGNPLPLQDDPEIDYLLKLKRDYRNVLQESEYYFKNYEVKRDIERYSDKYNATNLYDWCPGQFLCITLWKLGCIIF